MDFKIENGNYSLTPSGHLERVEGMDEIKQSILLVLSIKKGSFVLDPSLGSELYKLYREKHSAVEGKAKQYVEDALKAITGLAVDNVTVSWTDSKQISIFVEFTYNGQSDSVGVIV